MNHILPTATTSDEKERDAECAVLPVGSFEQHGEYLPLITDTVIASVLSRELASAYPLLELPPVTISCSHEHSAWPGTVSISSSTLHALIDDIYRSITESGHASLVIVNCHGGNYFLANVVQEANAHGKKNGPLPVREGLGGCPAISRDRHVEPRGHARRRARDIHPSPRVPRPRPGRLSPGGLGSRRPAPSPDHRDEGIHAKRSDRPTVSGFGGERQGSARRAGRELRIRAGDPATLDGRRGRGSARLPDDLMGLGFDVTRMAALGEYFERVKGRRP